MMVGKNCAKNFRVRIFGKFQSKANIGEVLNLADVEAHFKIMVKVKICCIASEAEAQLAIGMGAFAVGLVGEMPSGPGPIPDERIFQIARIVPSHIHTFLLTCETSAQAIIEHHRRTLTNTIQIVDALTDRAYHFLRENLPGVKLVQVIHVIDDRSIDEAVEIAPMVDYLLLDSGNPNLQVKELGGTGRVHNWQISRKIVEAVGKPVFLAGGLKPENVRQAVETVQPFGVDLCSGVRTNGDLDAWKLERFFANLRD